MGHPGITQVKTAVIRVVGPGLLVRLWAGDTYSIGECHPCAPVAAVDSVVTPLVEQFAGEDGSGVRVLAS